QEIEALGNDVGGVVVTTKIYGPDTNLDGNENNPLIWDDLEGYYRMNLLCGDLDSYKGVSGRLRNITSSQQETAPLPYTSRANQLWTTDDTWTNFSVWDIPNSTGINGDPIDWNIVRTSHNISSGDKDITVLGLVVENNELSIEDPTGPYDETNDGQMLWVTHYLKLNGQLDLVGESQLIQKRYEFYDHDNDGDFLYSTSKVSHQFNGSVFDNTSSGIGERDQQGHSNPFNYNYWSSPFAPNNATVNGEITSNSYSIGSVLRDGTTNVPNPINETITWINSKTAQASDPIQISTRWLYSFWNKRGNTYSEWDRIGNSTSVNIGLGYIMKGSGNGATTQNYVFVGKPNNGTITNDLSGTTNNPKNQILVGNPYPSAIDAAEFIKDNIPGGNAGSTGSIDGTLLFWDHYATNDSHILRDYEGGYALFNLSGGQVAVNPPPTEDGYIINGRDGAIAPERYIPVGQGFFVTGTDASGVVAFNNDQRIFKREASSGGDGSIFFEVNNNLEELEGLDRQSETSDDYESDEDKIQRIRLRFKSPEGAIRPLLIGFTPNNEATDGFDYGYDAINPDYFPSDMSWLIDEGRYVIQGVGAFETSKIYPLGINLAISGNIEIELEAQENFDSEIPVYIYDALLNTYTQFNSETFKLPLDPGDFMDRFFLAFQDEDTLNTSSNTIQSMRLYYLEDTHEIYINWANSYDIKKVVLLNILGQTIRTWQDITPLNQTEIKIPVENVSDGNYIIKVVNSKGKTTNKKVIIKE
ncbi:MAG: T9SS type A sorting domain-containing protein, partial [Flavobacteriaceae bacterium]|nr:T9SS type A sorting domain-containing protein [Flavobacteriaceae bacterium]